MTDRIETERMLRESEARCDAAAERRVVYVIDLNEKPTNMRIRPNPIDKHVGGLAERGKVDEHSE